MAKWSKSRRIVRYGLLALNVGVLIGVVFYVLQSSPDLNLSSSAAAATTDSDTSINPLDQLSSADIALNVAQATNLPETTAIANQADSVDSELAGPSVTAPVVSKPQAVDTDLNSRTDITTYVVQPGDTIASIASQFGITSNSIIWSNGIVGNSVSPGNKLAIPPVSGIVYTVKSGDTPASLAQYYNANEAQIIAYNNVENDSLPVGEQILIPGDSNQRLSRQILSTR